MVTRTLGLMSRRSGMCRRVRLLRRADRMAFVAIPSLTLYRPMRRERSPVGDDRPLVQVVEDVPRRLRLATDDNELLVAHFVGDGRHATHPHALLLRSRDLVADALAADLANRRRDIIEAAAMEKPLYQLSRR